MKKVLYFILLCSAVAVFLAGCGVPKPRATGIVPRTKTENTDNPNKRTVEVEIDKNNDVDRAPRLGDIMPIFGVRRRLPNFAGDYSVEYVHAPRDKQKDDTLQYSLTLRDDNTYDMTVVTDGVQANHYGNWYMRSGASIILYYDEPIEDAAHNVFVSDCMFGEILPQGKIMIFDDGNVIVLSKLSAEQTPTYAYSA